MQRVVELKTEPVVGQRYLVPCVLFWPRLIGIGKAVWIPVFGPLHDDKQYLNVEKDHWHIDFRFMTRPMMRARNLLWSRRDIFAYGMFPDTPSLEKQEPAERTMKCVSRMPHYHSLELTKKLEDAFADATVVNVGGCRTCPHRGLPLDGLPREEDGSVVCRGHGLCWREDGTMLRRVAQKAGV
jgi:hypothetical protein